MADPRQAARHWQPALSVCGDSSMPPVMAQAERQWRAGKQAGVQSRERAFFFFFRD